MFGLGFGEMLLILAVALVVIGPKKLPEVARLLGRGLAEFRRHSDEIQRTIQREIHAPLKTEDILKKATAQIYPGPPPAEEDKTAVREEVAPTPPTEPAA